MIDRFLAELRATSALEAAAVLLGLAYVLLVIGRSRIGWIAGGASSAIYVYLSAKAELPMQAALNLFYVLMSAYGWWTWTRMAQEEGRVYRWPVRAHLLPLIAVVVVSLASASWLARETHAAWPWLDSLTTWGSLFATWLTARMQLDNWLYWIILDALVGYLFAVQGLMFTAALYLVYVVMAVLGYHAWLRKYRQAA